MIENKRIEREEAKLKGLKVIQKIKEDKDTLFIQLKNKLRSKYNFIDNISDYYRIIRSNLPLRKIPSDLKEKSIDELEDFCWRSGIRNIFFNVSLEQLKELNDKIERKEKKKAKMKVAKKHQDKIVSKIIKIIYSSMKKYNK